MNMGQCLQIAIALLLGIGQRYGPCDCSHTKCVTNQSPEDRLK